MFKNEEEMIEFEKIDKAEMTIQTEEALLSGAMDKTIKRMIELWKNWKQKKDLKIK